MRSMAIRTGTAAAGAVVLAVSLAVPAAAAGHGSDQGPAAAPPGMAVMHEQLMRNDVAMAQMTRLMSEGNPGMARMH